MPLSFTQVSFDMCIRFIGFMLVHDVNVHSIFCKHELAFFTTATLTVTIINGTHWTAFSQWLNFLDFTFNISFLHLVRSVNNIYLIPRPLNRRKGSSKLELDCSFKGYCSKISLYAFQKFILQTWSVLNITLKWVHLKYLSFNGNSPISSSSQGFFFVFSAFFFLSW